MTLISKTDIEAAYRNIRKDIVCTPLLYSQKLSRLCGCQVLLKLENFQLTGAFKERGALNKLLSLSPEQKGKGVVAASAGNHAQAVAYHCQRLGIRSKIVMPVGTPLVKIVSTQGYGAGVILHGEMVDDAGDLAPQISMEGRIAQMTVRLKDLPGSLTAALEIIKALQANILEVVHHRLDSLVPFGYVDVSITLETKGHGHIHEIQGALQGAGYLCEDQCGF